MTDIHFPGEKGKNIPGSVGIAAWSCQRKTQNSGFLLCIFHCVDKDKLADGPPTSSLGGKKTPQVRCSRTSVFSWPPRCSLPTASQHRRGGAKQRARAGPTHGWMAHGWTELASSGIRSQENTPRVVVVFLLWGYCLRTSETGQLPGGIQWLSMALPLAPSFPTGILLLLF